MVNINQLVMKPPTTNDCYYSSLMVTSTSRITDTETPWTITALGTGSISVHDSVEGSVSISDSDVSVEVSVIVPKELRSDDERTK